MEDIEQFYLRQEFIDSLKTFEPDKGDLLLDQMAETLAIRDFDDNDWEAPLNGKDIEALDKHPYLSTLTVRFPEPLQPDIKDFFARGLRAGVVYNPVKSALTTFMAENLEAGSIFPLHDRTTPN